MDPQAGVRAITDWLFENYMILNSAKCHYMCIGKNCIDDTFIHNGKSFENSTEETILGVATDSKLTFDSHQKGCVSKLFRSSQHFHKYQLLLI